MPRSLRCFLLLIAFAPLGCNTCGERKYLFPLLHERLSGDEGSDSSRSATGKECGPNGHPVSRNNSGAGYGNGEVIYVGPAMPAGQPYAQPYNPRPDELPQPGGYIPSPGVPFAPQRPVDSTKLLPKPGGTMTGDPKK